MTKRRAAQGGVGVPRAPAETGETGGDRGEVRGRYDLVARRDEQPLDDAGGGRRDRRLHLHRREHDERLSLADRVARLDLGLGFGA